MCFGHRMLNNAIRPRDYIHLFRVFEVTHRPAGERRRNRRDLAIFESRANFSRHFVDVGKIDP